MNSDLSEHIIYSIKYEHYYGDDVDEYIGVTTVTNGNKYAALRKRWRGHVSAAKTQKKDWKLSKAIREHGEGAFDFEILESVKGKTKAHKLERAIIRERKPSLNTDTRSKEVDLEEMKYFVIKTELNGRPVWFDECHEYVYDERYAKTFGEHDAKRLLKYLKKYNENSFEMQQIACM